jgi:hypothetical protein
MKIQAIGDLKPSKSTPDTQLNQQLDQWFHRFITPLLIFLNLQSMQETFLA